MAGDAIYTTVLRTPSIGNSLTLTVTATAPGKIGISVNVTYPLLPRPSNDDFANAIKIRASGDSVVGNNKFASMESQEPLHARVPTVENSVWWNFRPASAAGCWWIQPAAPLIQLLASIRARNSGSWWKWRPRMMWANSGKGHF